MKRNQNTVAAINHRHATWIKFHDHSWPFHQSLKKLAVFETYFRSWGRTLVTVAVLEKWPLVEVRLYYNSHEIIYSR